MNDLFRQLRKIRNYAIYCAVVFSGFVWAQWRGHRVIGDDNESKEQAVSNSHNGRYNYYHK